jgi:hypothetical protein
MPEIATFDENSRIIRVKIRDSTSTTGAGKTGLTFASTGLIISTIASSEASATAYTVAAGKVEDISTLGTYAAPTATKCRFKQVDSTNHPGLYEIQLADARFAIAGSKSLIVSVLGATGIVPVDVHIPLTGFDLGDADPSVDVTKVAGVTVTTSTAMIGVNVVTVGGTTQTARDMGVSVLIAPGTATGQLSVAAGVIAANVTNIAGSAVSTTTAQIGTNVVAISGDTTATDNLETACDGGTFNLGGGGVVAASVTTKTGYELAADQAVNVTKIAGTTVSTNSAQIGVNVVAISGDTTATDNLETACDGGTFNMGGGGIVASSVTTKTGYELAADQAVNITKIAGTTVSTASAQIGVNLIDIAGTTVSSASAQIGVNVVAITSGMLNGIADAILKRDWTEITGEASRSVLNALRVLRNAIKGTGATKSVKKEDDSTEAFSIVCTTATSADVILETDPS